MGIIAERFQWTLALGPAFAAALLLPLVVGHHLRFGGVEGRRLGWSLAAAGYAGALAAFTLLPLPEFTPAFCAARAAGPAVLLDPTELPRAAARAAASGGAAGALRAWPVQEAALNVALFLPRGLFSGRLLEWPRRRVLPLALATSLLVEATQATGNWGLAPCPYRFADVTDVLTNVAGAAAGLLLARVLPAPRRTLGRLEARRGAVRPVTGARRLTGMAVDACALAVAAAVGAVAALPWAGAGGAAGFAGMPAPIVGAWAGCLALVGGAALTGPGGSIGQRVVHLRPMPPCGGAAGRAVLLLRALAGQGVAVTLSAPAAAMHLADPGAAGAAAQWVPWAAAAAIWAVACAAPVPWRVAGLTGLLTGCRMRDARAGG